MIRTLLVSLTLFYVAAPLIADDDGTTRQKKGPLRVYILSGQSNTLGKAKIAHLDKLLADPKTADDYDHIRKDGKWIERKDVWVRFFDRKGNLNGSYGDWNANVNFGPELGFGHKIGAELDEQVLVIKVAWGGRDLARNFRPPSRGLVDNPGAADLCYAHTVWFVHNTLQKLPELFPDFDASRGYELCGFIWFQGWNDAINGAKRAEYEENLKALAKDLRKDLGVPELPFIVGELGQGGPDDKSGPTMQMRTAQKNAVKAVANAAYVPTSQYVRSGGEQYDGGYHYFGRADTMLDIGEAFAEAALKLTPKEASDQSKQITKAWKAYEQSPQFKQLLERNK